MTGSAPHILVVDDEEDIRMLSTLMLEPIGYTVSTADSVASTLQRVRDEEFDLVLLDLGLPDGNGRDVLQTWKAEGRVPDLPVVVVSAYGHEIVADELDDMCAVGYIRKPYDMADLRRQVADVLSERA